MEKEILLKKVTRLAVSLLIISSLFFHGCMSAYKINERNKERNSMGYAVHMSRKPTGFPTNKLYIHGQIRYGYNNKAPKKSKVTFIEENGAKYEVYADKRGKYAILIDDFIFDGKIIVNSLDIVGGSLTIDHIFIGKGNDCELNLKLYVFEGFFSEEMELNKETLLQIREEFKEKRN